MGVSGVNLTGEKGVKGKSEKGDKSRSKGKKAKITFK